MIYLNAFLRVFKKFLKVVRAGKNGVKWGKMGVKRLTQNPHLYTTGIIANKRTMMVLYRSPEHICNLYGLSRAGY